MIDLISLSLKIFDNEEKQKRLDFEFVFKLKNAIGYKYAEKINVTFERIKMAKETVEEKVLVWEIAKYNTEFLKWSDVK